MITKIEILINAQKNNKQTYLPKFTIKAITGSRH